MRRKDFERYMQWFAPKMAWCLAHADLPYAQAQPRWLSYLLERLFIIWYQTAGKRAAFVGGWQPTAPVAEGALSHAHSTLLR
jgi:hypothetical protein